MAVPTEPLSGISSLIVVDSTLVGAQTDATLNLPSDVVDVATKNDFGWRQTLPGVTSWSLDTGNLVKDTANAKPFLSNDSPNRVSVSIDIGGVQTNIAKMTDVSITATQDVELVSTHDGGLEQSLFLGERDVSVDITALYLDPAATTSQFQELLDARDNATDLDAVITIDQLTISGSFSLSDLSISGQAQASPIETSFSLSSNGPVTKGGTDFDTSVSMILSGFFGQSLVTSAFELQDNTGAISGSTRYEGDGYFTDVSLDLSTESAASMTSTVTGDGAITTAPVT